MKYLVLLLATITVAVGVLAADVDLAPETMVSNVEDLRILLRKSQAEWMVVSPPSVDMVYWDSRNDEDVFVDWFSGEWPESAAKLAVAG